MVLTYLLYTALALIVANVVYLVVRNLLASSVKFENKHVIITGASTGLGKAVALRFAELGSHVTLISRDATRLNAARDEAAQRCKSASQKITAVAADVTKYDQVKDAIEKALALHDGRCDILVTSAGLASPGYFLEQDIDTFRKMMDLNYFGTLHAVKECVPAMVRQRGGNIVMVSSAMDLIAFAGYSQYSASKFAVRGLAECLRNELCADNIKLSLYHASSMDTPGFEQENRSKPIECKEIEGSGVLFKPEQCAEEVVNAVRYGRFHITQELGTFLLSLGNTSITPTNYGLFDLLLVPIAWIASRGFGLWADYVVKSRSAARKKQA